MSSSVLLVLCLSFCTSTWPLPPCLPSPTDDTNHLAGCQAERMQQMAERRTAELEASLALSTEDQVAIEHMYEDQGITVHYDEPMPFSSADSDQDDDNDGYDMEEEFNDLTKQWFMAIH
ncbi:hypothetical protein HD554DRAFT_2040084 [Boletus coccyginus]|nr:hypothetical protein HD554DRAFT_2040084 [Boletus coccyginus]